VAFRGKDYIGVQFETGFILRRGLGYAPAIVANRNENADVHRGLSNAPIILRDEKPDG
jgi:hypothetical protein